MPPASPVPGWSRGEVWRLIIATRSPTLPPRSWSWLVRVLGARRGHLWHNPEGRPGIPATFDTPSRSAEPSEVAGSAGVGARRGPAGGGAAAPQERQGADDEGHATPEAVVPRGVGWPERLDQRQGEQAGRQADD